MTIGESLAKLGRDAYSIAHLGNTNSSIRADININITETLYVTITTIHLVNGLIGRGST